MPLKDISAEQLLDSLSTGAMIISQGRITRINPAFQQLLQQAGNGGGESFSPIGKSPAELLSLADKIDCPFCRGTGTDFDPVHGARLISDEEEKTRVKIKHSPLPDGSTLCLISLFSEDAALIQAHSDFVSTVSHEFRTPLTSIKGFADTMLQYGNQLPEEQQRRFIHIIKEQADRMIRLTENLLTVSRVGARRIELSYRPVSLPKMAERVVQSIQAKLGERDERRFIIEMHPALPDVWADADRLEQVLLNLIDNAVKYSKTGGQVRISGEMDARDPGRVLIRISDQGIGIPAEFLPRLFTKFYRIDTPLTQQVEGTGLGLYIVKSLTTSMGGEISVASEPGVGTTFTLVFPAATPERQAIHRRRLFSEPSPAPDTFSQGSPETTMEPGG